MVCEKTEDKNTMVTKETIFCVESPFKNNTELFDNKDMFPDMVFVVAGLESPLLLHKGIMAKTSKLVDGLLKAKQTAKTGDSNQIEWPFDTTNERDRAALVKALRFCYDETMTVDAKGDELCAVIAALCRLQVTCLDEMMAKLTGFAVEQAKKDASVGKELLKETQLYPECCNPNTVELDKALTKVVLTRKNICDNFETVVGDCLMKLPMHFLDMAEYGDPHTPFSEFNIRARYLKEHDGTLTKEEKEMVMKKCDWTKLMSKELMTLRELDIMGKDAMIEACSKALENIEEKLREYKERFEREKEKSESILITYVNDHTLLTFL